MPRAATAALFLAAFGSAARSAPAAADDALLALGRHLARECTACHRLDGADSGIPPIAGREADDLVAAMSLYKSGERSNPIMVSVAQSLDERQIRALALYLSSLKKPPPAEPAARKPAPRR